MPALRPMSSANVRSRFVNLRFDSDDIIVIAPRTFLLAIIGTTIAELIPIDFNAANCSFEMAVAANRSSSTISLQTGTPVLITLDTSTDERQSGRNWVW